MPETIVDPSTGTVVQVVDPGSPEDPFRAGANDASAESVRVETPSETTQVPVQTSTPDATPVPEATPSTPVAETKPAPTATPAVTTDSQEASTEEDVEALKHLSDYLDNRIKESVDPALRQQQSTYDRTINKLQESLGAKDTVLEQLTKEIRELKINGLPEEEQARLRTLYDNEDEKAKLTAWQTELEDYHRELSIAAYVNEYGAYGVTKELLEDGKTPEEMEARCYEAKATFFEQKANGLGVTETVKVAPAPVTATPAPQGANSPSDVGGGGSIVQKPAFSQDSSPDALAANLKNLETVSIRVN